MNENMNLVSTSHFNPFDEFSYLPPTSNPVQELSGNIGMYWF